MNWLLSLSAWHWFSLAVVLLIIEMLVGSYYLLWICFAAALTAAAVWLFEFGWQIQFAVFTAVSIASVLIWREYDKRRDKTPVRPHLNKRGHQYIGRSFQLSQPIVNGVGKITVDDSTWKVRGEDADINHTVRVTGVDGTILIVQTEENNA